MNVVATADLDQYAHYQVGYDILSTNTEQGYHDIRCYGVLSITGYYATWTRASASVLDNWVDIGTYYSTGSYTLVSKDIRVYADANGKCSTQIYGVLDTTYRDAYPSGTAYLPDIPRYPILNNASNFKDNENPVYNITAYGNYTIKIKLEAGGNSQLITRTLSNKNSQVYTLELTDQERTTLRNMMTGDSLNVRMTVCALQNGNETSWSYKDVKMIKGSHYVKLRVNGVWKDAIPYVRVNGTWKEAIPYTRVNGTWKEGI